MFIRCDLRDVEALRAAIGQAEAAHGAATVLINNAALDTRHDVADVTVDFWDNNLAVNLRPHFFTAQAVVPGMRAAGRGSIINFTSTSFMINHPDMPAYTAAKAGIIGLTKGLAGKLGRWGIRVNAIAPGWVITERQRELWVTEEALAAHVATPVHPRSDGARGHGRPLPVPRLGCLAHADRPDHDCRRRFPLSAAGKPAVAVADWGTTRLRVWLLDGAGAVVGERRSDEGLLSAQPDRFGEILERQLADMGAPAALPAVICGMAGSRQGWTEVPYVDVPAALGTIFASAARVPGVTRDVRIVPGLAQRDAARPDVMRGEETQLAGAMARLAAGRHLACMPGTHSKWVEIRDGTVAGFQTFMTGELFSVLSAQSILRHSIGEETQVAAVSPAFAGWCKDALDSPAPIELNLFRIRAATLLQDLQPRDAAAALSGVLIGAEIAAARARFAVEGNPVSLVASGAMHDLYATALRLAGFAVISVDADEAVRKGLAEAARHLGIDRQGRGRHEHSLPEICSETWSPSCAACIPTRPWRWARRSTRRGSRRSRCRSTRPTRSSRSRRWSAPCPKTRSSAPEPS